MGTFLHVVSRLLYVYGMDEEGGTVQDHLSETDAAWEEYFEAVRLAGCQLTDRLKALRKEPLPKSA